MKLLTCAAEGCDETFEFDPQNPLKEYHSVQCQRRMRVRRWRAKHKNGPAGGGPGSKRTPLLFPKQSVSAKRLKRERPPETAPLFAMFPNGMHEKHAGPVETYPDPANSANAAVGHFTCYRTKDESAEVKPPASTNDESFDQAAA